MASNLPSSPPLSAPHSTDQTPPALRYRNAMTHTFRASVSAQKALKALLQVSGGVDMVNVISTDPINFGDQHNSSLAHTTVSEVTVRQNLSKAWHFWDEVLRDGTAASNECGQLLRPTSTPAYQIIETHTCSVLRQKISIDLTQVDDNDEDMVSTQKRLENMTLPSTIKWHEVIYVVDDVTSSESASSSPLSSEQDPPAVTTSASSQSPSPAVASKTKAKDQPQRQCKTVTSTV